MDYELVIMLRSAVGELGIVVANFVEAQKGQSRERIASEQMAAMWTYLGGTESEFPITREDVAAEAVHRADALLAALEAMKS